MAIAVLAKPSMQGDPMVQIRPRSGQTAWPFEAQRPRLRARTLLLAVFVASIWPAVVGAAGLDNGGGPGAPPSAENSTGAVGATYRPLHVRGGSMAAMIAREWEKAGRLFARSECARQGQENQDIANRRNEDDTKQPTRESCWSGAP